MKFKILFLTFTITAIATFAQAPDMFSYQATVRNALGALITNANVGLKISILQGSATSTVVYSETKTLTTNENGLFTTMIGSGPATVGTFSGINWGSGLYFTKTEIDPTGGTNYGIVATSQMLSVPYALYAKQAGNFANSSGFVHYPGELFGGGIVFYVYKDATSEHGLIVSTEDLCTTCGWSNVTTAQIGAAAQSTWDGASNTAAIIAQAGHTSSAAKLCVDYRGGGFADWYLPAIDELKLFWSNIYHVNKALNTDGNPATVGFEQYNNSNSSIRIGYTSSTEFGNNYRYVVYIIGQRGRGQFDDDSKDISSANAKFVRAIRKF
ncbi:MAG: hypothetical protein EAZ53_03115 [Bacteroidetes bacterium]|nr:MAG: hypothetical protein EAZ53_03115 [Bacteroidota bacterium]